MTKISIVMPVKNTAVYLEKCLNSIGNQTYQNWELIAVDDGSEDESYQILKGYSEKDNRIKVLKNTGKGIIDALQLAYQHSKGSYITRMDSDDIMSEDKLELMIKALEEKGRGYLAVGLVSYFSDGVLQNGYQRYGDWLNALTNKATNFEAIYKECVIPSPCWMLHRTDFEKCGGFESKIYPEDYDLAFRFRKGGLKIAPVRKIVHYWRDYPTRTSRTDSNYADNRFTALKIQYFLSEDRKLEMPLLLWGAGRKGKKIAQLLQEANIDFGWFCNNIKKIGKDIYGVTMQDMTALELPEAQVIVAVSSPDDSNEIEELMKLNGQHEYFRFF